MCIGPNNYRCFDLCRDVSGQCSDHSSKRETIMGRDRVCRASRSRSAANEVQRIVSTEYRYGILLTIRCISLAVEPLTISADTGDCSRFDTAHDSVYLISGVTAYDISWYEILLTIRFTSLAVEPLTISADTRYCS
eukprot:sb/3474596/